MMVSAASSPVVITQNLHNHLFTKVQADTNSNCCSNSEMQETKQLHITSQNIETCKNSFSLAAEKSLRPIMSC